MSAALAGDFYPAQTHVGRSGAPLVQGLRSMPLRPDAGRTGTHMLEAVLQFRDPERDRPDLVFERARSLVSTVAALISLGTGRRVWVDRGITARRFLHDHPSTYRRIMGLVDSAEVAPPEFKPLAVRG